MINLNDLLRSIIQDKLGLDDGRVRPANQNAPTADDQYITVFIALIDSEGWDSVKLSPQLNQVLETVEGVRLCRITIQAFKYNAVFLLTLLKNKLQQSSVIETLNLHNVTISKFYPVSDISIVRSTFWEERAKFEIDVYAVVKSEETLNTFGTFPIAISSGSITTTSEVFEP